MDGDDATRRDAAGHWAQDHRLEKGPHEHGRECVVKAWIAGNEAATADRDAAVARARREGVAAEHKAMLWEIVEMVTESLSPPGARFTLCEAGGLIVKAIHERDRASSEPRP